MVLLLSNVNYSRINFELIDIDQLRIDSSSIARSISGYGPAARAGMLCIAIVVPQQLRRASARADRYRKA